MRGACANSKACAAVCVRGWQQRVEHYRLEPRRRGTGARPRHVRAQEGSGIGPLRPQGFRAGLRWTCLRSNLACKYNQQCYITG